MRAFQFSDAKSHKFWAIDVQGASFTVTYGKVGTAGQAQTKSFADAATAQREADKLIKEKTKKGYTETTPKASATEAEAFEASLRENPNDLAGWCAYADYLAEQGDPRGEFMQTQLALEDESRPKAERDALKKKEAALLKKHEREWVGEWADLFPAPDATEGRGQINHTGGRKYEFKRGVLAAAHFGELTVAAARVFVKSPQTRFVRELFIGYHNYEEAFEPGPDIPADVAIEDQAADHALLRWPHLRHVRRFQYGWIADEVYDDFCNFQCHLTGDRVFDFVKQMPDVEEVLVFAHLRDATKLVALPLPNLRVLQLYHGWSYPLDKLAKNPSLTNLTHLLCHPHALDDEDPYIRLPGLRGLPLAAPHESHAPPPSVERLRRRRRPRDHIVGRSEAAQGAGPAARERHRRGGEVARRVSGGQEPGAPRPVPQRVDRRGEGRAPGDQSARRLGLPARSNRRRG